MLKIEVFGQSGVFCAAAGAVIDGEMLFCNLIGAREAEFGDKSAWGLGRDGADAYKPEREKAE